MKKPEEVKRYSFILAIQRREREDELKKQAEQAAKSGTKSDNTEK